MSATLHHMTEKRLFFNISKRMFGRETYSKYFAEIHPPDTNTALISSALKKPTKSKLSNELRNKHQIQLPVYQGTAKEKHRKQYETESKETDAYNILDGKSKLLRKFNQESDVYIKGNTPFVNRKYEPLIEQIEHITKPLDQTEHKDANEAEMKQDLHKMSGADDFEGIHKPSPDMLKSPMKMHENWNFFFSGEFNEPLYNESETWNVIAHVNKRYGYGKSLRYSDRFYRNWAIEVAEKEDVQFNDQRQEYAKEQQHWR